MENINKCAATPRRRLVEAVRGRLGGTATPMAAELALRAVASVIRDGLRRDGEVRLARFGTFRLKTCRARRLLLPGSDREMTLPERREIRFRELRSKN